MSKIHHLLRRIAPTLIIGLSACGEGDTSYSPQAAESELWDEVRSKIFVMSIHGRGAATRNPGENDYRDTGMSVLLDSIASELQAFGIPAANLRKLQWNADYESSVKRPDVDYIESQMPAPYRSDPIYTAILGHSYGAYAAGKVSESYVKRLGYKPDYVATIDPVLGIENRDSANFYGQFMQNWYQTNGIGDLFGSSTLCIADTLSCRFGESISCGQSLQDKGFDTSTKVNVQHNRSGTKKMMSCLGLTKNKPQMHTTIDEDGLIHQQIIDKVRRDIKRIYDAVTQARPGVLKIKQGFFKVVGREAIYSSNGSNAYCHVVASDRVDYSRVTTYSSKFLDLTGFRKDGPCTYAIDSGLFRVPNQSAIYSSNGQDAYCKLLSTSQIGSISVNTFDSDVTAITHYRFDGYCQESIPSGFFRTPNSSIFFSNGEDAFCQIPHLSLVTDPITRHYSYDVTRVTPFRNDGICRYPIPYKFFKVAGGSAIYSSNGSTAFCRVATVEQVDGPVHSYPFDILNYTNFRNDGTCR